MIMDNQSKKVLIKFGHGIGDAVQLTVVLQHIQKYRPNWIVDIFTSTGKDTIFEYLCNKVYLFGTKIDETQYDSILDLSWHEPWDTSNSHPCTKAEKCLKEVFEISIDKELCKYKIVNQQDSQLVTQYLSHVCQGKNKINGRWPAVIIHYQGNTAAQFKNLNHDTIEKLCNTIIKLGYVPIILDWDRRSYLPDNKKIFCPDSQCFLWGNKNVGNAKTIASLIDNSSLFIGIDSGPQKIAGATSTKVLAIWTRHHPINYYGLNKNVYHFVPLEHKNFIKSNDKDICMNFFRKEYNFNVYTNLDLELINTTYNILTDKSDIFDTTNISDVINEYIKPLQDNIELLNLKKSQLVNKIFIYERCGYDKRDMQLLADGIIGQGSAGMERKWNFIFRDEIPTLIIKADNDTITFEAKQDHQGIWHGRWNAYEKMPIMLIPKDLLSLDINVNDFTILIQGPLNRTSINNIKNYTNFGKIIISCWANDDLSLLSSIQQDMIVIKNTFPLENINNKNNMGKQIISTLNGLQHCKTKYCVKVRSDESFTNLAHLLEKIKNNTDKIISINNGFNNRPYHPSDHVLAGDTEVLTKGFENALKLAKGEIKNPLPSLVIAPERFICFGILMSKGIEPNSKDWVKHMKDNFDLVQMNTLGEILWICNSRGFSSRKDDYNNFALEDRHKTICTMDELGKNITFIE